MTEVAFELFGDLEEPGRARAFVADQLEGYSRDTHDDALLLVSELVTNVVQHGGLPAHLTLRLAAGRLHVQVHDSSPSMPDGPREADTRKNSGRGLIIVASVATSWGIVTTEGTPGKGVWFELPVVL